MTIPKPALKAPQPTKIFFDPFNSSSTGHQTAANRLSGSISWRDSRTYKLAHQLQDSTGRGGTQHLADLVGAGSENFRKDGKKDNGDWEKGAPGLREDGWQDIRGILSGTKKRSRDDAGDSSDVKRQKTSPTPPTHLKQHAHSSRRTAASRSSTRVPSTPAPDSNPDNEQTTPGNPLPQIFSRLAIYVNGSTLPLIGDHKLKRLFVSHGGSVCLSLARRTVTHVILDETGALARGKVQKEVRKVGGEQVWYVTAQWVVDSVAAGRRKGEGPYMPKNLGIAGCRQRTVGEMLSKPTKES